MKRVRIHATKRDQDGVVRPVRVFDALLDKEKGDVLLDVKDKRGNIILPLSSVLSQINDAHKAHITSTAK